jgi:hypothetical protein
MVVAVPSSNHDSISWTVGLAMIETYGAEEADKIVIAPRMSK